MMRFERSQWAQLFDWFILFAVSSLLVKLPKVGIRDPNFLALWRRVDGNSSAIMKFCYSRNKLHRHFLLFYLSHLWWQHYCHTSLYVFLFLKKRRWRSLFFIRDRALGDAIATGRRRRCSPTSHSALHHLPRHAETKRSSRSSPRNFLRFYQKK